MTSYRTLEDLVSAADAALAACSVATRLFVALNGHNARAPSPRAGDEFVRVLAQGQFGVSGIASTPATWCGPSTH